MNPIPLVVFLAVAAGSIVVGAPPPQASSTNLPPATFDGKVDVGGYKLRLVTYGQGTPTVVVEAGGSQAGVDNPQWISVIQRIAKTTRICVYDRANLGSSDVAPAKSRTSQDVATDLHVALLAAKVPGPFIVVGHSMGGFNARVFASRYPKEVVGVILVESAHPDQWSKLLAALPQESRSEPEDVKRVRKDLTSEISDPSWNLEKMDVAASAAQARAAGMLGDKPLVVLTRSPKAYTGGKGIQNILEPIWQDLQVDLSRLSSNGTHKIAAKAGHFIQVDEPQLVIDAILKVASSASKENKPR